MNLPSTIRAAADTLRDHGGQARAGGTDLTARAGIGRTSGPFVDLRGVAELRGSERRPDGSVRIGAMTTIAEIAADPLVTAGHPALAAAAARLATPQIRTVATLGGNLLQRNRCWYYRNPAFSCHQSGGQGCPARTGASLYSAVIDRGPCVAPHPSSLAVALLAYDATVRTHRLGVVPAARIYGDGDDPTRDHLLEPDDVLIEVTLPPPAPSEGWAHHRAAARAAAEWPLVEAVARVGRDGGRLTSVAVAVGGVARVPLRLPEVERAVLRDGEAPESLSAAAARVADSCSPLADNGYKVELLRATVLEVLEQALAAPSAKADVDTPAREG
ncbi:FAD binding domain-containing protein [Marinactinospora thermotolerans]|uniref:Xanthine dehydrogenase YagS FAD-binding subunit n=1 Tax=Marinactinospora thermotolerans DSM 45154 TaxID=1122192 RepID=A0A1T4P5B7_9ACTN|nr:FAD binding domain-containing protein [Marinactinospora thermotolerans]SJZ86694.1 xanthine dehydrogenase YagS FAD-binding subunit [Marinactinospora thermotolerans DSM 45154]